MWFSDWIRSAHVAPFLHGLEVQGATSTSVIEMRVRERVPIVAPTGEKMLIAKTSSVSAHQPSFRQATSMVAEVAPTPKLAVPLTSAMSPSPTEALPS